MWLSIILSRNVYGLLTNLYINRLIYRSRNIGEDPRILEGGCQGPRTPMSVGITITNPRGGWG